MRQCRSYRSIRLHRGSGLDQLLSAWCGTSVTREKALQEESHTSVPKLWGGRVLQVRMR